MQRFHQVVAMLRGIAEGAAQAINRNGQVGHRRG
jgi:hypothetical protein